MDIRGAINELVEFHDLGKANMQAVMRQIMQGETTPSQIGGFLIALRMKGETVDEIAAAAEVMREYALKVQVRGDHQVDIVGTGGDGVRTFNVSTTAAFVIAAAGGRVAKHHARSASSHVGSADVLEKAGVRLGLPPEQVVRCIDKLGVGFMFAPAHHSAMRHVSGTRKELGTRTLFNVLGPLANPAQVPNMLLGVYKRDLVEPMAEVLRELGAGHVLVVHSQDGLDEISISDVTHVAELKGGHIHCYDIEPGDFGLKRQPVEKIITADLAESLAMLRDVLDNKAGAARDIVVLNAGAAIYAAGLAADIKAGMERAAAVIADGSAKSRLEELAAFSHALT